MLKFEYGQNINADRCIEYFREAFFNRIPAEFQGKVWIAGGAVRDFLKNGTVTLDTDLDVFSNSVTTISNLTEHLVSQEEFEIIVKNDNVTKTKGQFLLGVNSWDGIDKTVLSPERKYDFVTHTAESPAETISEFDFTVAGFAVTPTTLVMLDSALFDLATRRLAINKLDYPISTMRRLPKYIRKGFIPCQGTMLALATACTTVDPKKIAELSKLYFD